MHTRVIRGHILIWAILLVALSPSSALAYIGPGAGFALAGSFMAVFGAVLSALFMVLSWPIRRVLRFLFRKRPPGSQRFQRVVVLAVEGLDHALTSRLIAEGKLPKLTALRDQGDFRSLGSTFPASSVVASCSFLTSVNPGKHNVFDVWSPALTSYQSQRSFTESVPRPIRGRMTGLRRASRLPVVQTRLKGQPFWSYLSQYDIFQCILRVPMACPTQALHGVQLYDECHRDVRGTVGTHSLYSTKSGVSQPAGERVEIHRVELRDWRIDAKLHGPTGSNGKELGPISQPFTVKVNRQDTKSATLKIDGSSYPLRLGEFSDWIKVGFRQGFGPAERGICRFLLLSTEPDFHLYVTPIAVDPERAATAIGYPPKFPLYLAKRLGPYGPLPAAEDWFAEGQPPIAEEYVLRQCIDDDRTREAMLMDSLQNVPSGLCLCSFSAIDRIQHLFWRYFDSDPHARFDQDPQGFKAAIEDAYVRMDQMVGRAMAECDPTHTLFLLVSGHGFAPVQRSVDLNRWLEENGYLVVDDSRRDEPQLAGVDWTQTRAFAVGLSSIFVNVRGKWPHGIVSSGKAAEALEREIIDQLRQFTDPLTGKHPIRRIARAADIFRGPYQDRGPDLVIGYAAGYSISWDTLAGRIGREIVFDNARPWSGDHCADPSLVPGVLFCNHRIDATDVSLMDIGPTVLSLFGVPVPETMDGRPFILDDSQLAQSPVPYTNRRHTSQVTS